MTQPLQSISIKAPGFLGLNTQQDSVNLNSNFCLTADNLVIDKAGRLSARQGWEYMTTAGVDVNLKGGIAFTETDGTVRNISWSDTAFYEGCETLTERTPTTTDTIEDGNWSAGFIDDNLYFFQAGYKPLIFSYATGSLVFEELDNQTSGTPPSGSIVATEYGRIWVAGVADNRLTLYFSDLLDGKKWDQGTAGSLNLASVVLDGADEITGVAGHNGYLIIFCKNNIVVYSDTDNFQQSLDVTSLTLVDVIKGVGCVSNETIQNVGDDLFFLSRTGLRSFGRTIQERALPLRDMSFNVRDDVINQLDQSTESLIRSAYSPEFAFYLLLFPDTGTIYCFDTRAPLDSGALRVTKWTKQTHQAICAYEKDVYFFQVKGVAKYSGYQDNDADYKIKFATNYLDFGDSSRIKILKKLNVTTICGVGQQLIVNPSFDYASTKDDYTYTLTGSPVYEYNVAEYNVAKFSSGLATDNTKASIGGSGNIIQIELTADIIGFQLAFQKIDLFVKQGRII